MAFPDEIPWEWSQIDRFLRKVIHKKGARLSIRKTLQALYSYLEKANFGLSPIPKGQVGRPAKLNPEASYSGLIPDKLGRGGQGPSSGLSSTSLFTRQVVDDFIKAKKDLSPATIRWYEYHFRPFILEYSELPLKPEPIEQHVFAISSTPEYQAGRFRALRALYHFLERRQRLPVDPQWGVINPFRQLTAPRIPKKLPASLDMGELQALIDVCKSPEEQALIALLADCGLRVGELVSLTREKIQDDFILVKGKTGERQVSISPELRDILLALVPSGPIFLNPWGQAFKEDGIYYQIKGLLKRAGIKKRHMGPHLLRHTFGRQSIAAGADLVTVQKMMGHSTIITTRIYTELSGAEVHKRHQETSPLKQLKLNFNGKLKRDNND